MITFVKNVFRGFMGFVLWINLILFIIGGGVFGNYFGVVIADDHDDKFGYVILGIFLGILFGLFVNIIFGGFVATIINIDKNIEKLVELFKYNVGISSKI